MYRAETDGIEVTVEPSFLEEQSDPDRDRYVWAYSVEIKNRSERTVRLRRRYWRITDAVGRVEEVRGAGVVGEQPTLPPGHTFRYTSGCPLATPSGIMVGNYEMEGEDGTPFLVAIPAFSLDLPSARPTLN